MRGGGGLDLAGRTRLGCHCAELSEVALDRAARAASERLGEEADRIRFCHADIFDWSPETTYDLVSAQFFHMPPEMRAGIWQKLADAVAEGGTLLVVAHDADDPHVKEHRSHEPQLFYKGSEIAEAIGRSGWTIVKNTVGHRTRSDTGEDFLDLIFRATRD
jgi:SAM-dependent methyltransferase